MLYPTAVACSFIPYLHRLKATLTEVSCALNQNCANRQYGVNGIYAEAFARRYNIQSTLRIFYVVIN